MLNGYPRGKIAFLPLLAGSILVAAFKTWAYTSSSMYRPFPIRNLSLITLDFISAYTSVAQRITPRSTIFPQSMP